MIPPSPRLRRTGRRTGRRASPGRDRGPSSLAERLLSLRYGDRAWAEAVVGDLREEYEAVARRAGPRAARRWHWAQTLRLVVHGWFGRTPLSTPRRTMPLPEPGHQGHHFAGLQRDIMYAVRSLAHRPALTMVMVGALALGLAANATIFTVLDAIVLRPFRFPTVDRLVVIASVRASEFFDTSSVTPADYLDWTEQATTVSDFAAIQWWEPNLTGRDAEPEQLAGFLVSPAYFGMMGAEAFRGRTFAADDGVPGAARRVLISHALWQRRFAADPAIVGQTLRLDGDQHEVVGIMPPGFQIPMGAEIWCPLVITDEMRVDRRSQSLTVIGRLVDGASIGSVRSEMATIVARQRNQHPGTNATRDVTIKGFMTGMRDAAGNEIVMIWQVAALLLLLVACANVLNLLLARGVERQQEFAVRLALGASRGRIMRQLLIEGAILATAAVACAVPLAWVGIRAQQLALPPSVIRFVPGWEYVQLQPRALLVTASLAALATMLFSLAPALHAARGVLANALRRAGRTTTPGRSRSLGRATVAGAQIALTLALLTGSALAIGAAYQATRGPLGFDRSQVLTAHLLLPNNPYDDKTKRAQLLDQVLERMEGVPAVQQAGATSALPYGQMNTQRPFYPEGVTLQPAEVTRVDLRRVTPRYLDVMRIPVLQGRGILQSDIDGGMAVALVSSGLARQYWPGADPLQRRFRLADNGPWLTVVGVVGDVTQDWFLNQRNPTVYRPASQDPPYNVAFAIRTTGDPMSLAGELRRAISAADPNQPIRDLMTMEQVVDQGATGLYYAANTLSAIGVIALMLALMGIYSLMSYLASRRTQEIGVRMAFGATRGDVVRLTLRQAAAITIAGLVVGVALAFAVSRAMQALMFGAVAPNPMLPFAIAGLLALAALAASYLPARRAAGLDPTVALKAE